MDSGLQGNVCTENVWHTYPRIDMKTGVGRFKVITERTWEWIEHTASAKVIPTGSREGAL